MHAAARKIIYDGGIDLLLHGKKTRNDAVNMVQLLRRCPAGFVVGVIRRHVSKIEETTNAHHEKLVEIARENRNKFQPLQSGNARVCRFFQHTPVKTQPAQFWVYLYGSSKFFGIDTLPGRRICRRPIVLHGIDETHAAR